MCRTLRPGPRLPLRRIGRPIAEIVPGGRRTGLGLPQPLHVLLRDLLQKPGGHAGSGAAEQHPLPGVGQGQLLLGPGHGHIAQPPLLLHFLRLSHGAIPREKPVLHAYHEHAGKLQSLGAVHSHQRHAVVPGLLAVQVRIQGHLVQEARQCGILRIVFQEGLDAGAELLHVFQAPPALHIVLLLEHPHIAAAAAHIFIELHQAHIVRLTAHFVDHLCKGRQLASACLQLGIVSCPPQNLHQRQALLRGDGLGLVHGGRADLPGGHVDDPPQPQVVGGVVDDAQIRQHVLHLGPVEELGAADDLIGHAVALEGILQGVGLGVHAVQHGVVLPVPPPAIVHHDLPHHIVGLVSLVEADLYGDHLPRSVLGPQGLALAAHVVADHGVGGVQNILGGAVVLLQPDGPGPGVLLFKAEDVLDVGPPEAIDALVVVAYHADVLPSPGQQAGQHILHVVGVLILVDEDIAELVPVIFQGLAVRLQKLHRVQDDVVKVQGIGIPQAAVIGGIDPAHPHPSPVAPLFPQLAELLGHHHGILGVGDHRQHLPHREGLFLQPHLLEDVLDDPLAVVGVVNGKAAVEADFVDVPAQDADTGRVEGGGPHVPGLLPQHLLQPVLQLVGGLVGEGDGQHLPGAGRLHGAEILHQRPLLRVRPGGILLQKFHLVPGNGQRYLICVAAPAIAQEVRHPVDQHRGLAGPGPRQQQQRPLSGQNPLQLPGVQVRIIRGNGPCPGLNKSFLQVVHSVPSPVCILLSHFNTIFASGQPLCKVCRIFVRLSLDKNVCSIYNTDRTNVFGGVPYDDFWIYCDAAGCRCFLRRGYPSGGLD